jgi:hypothetical protein
LVLDAVRRIGLWWHWSPDQCIGRSPIEKQAIVGFADDTGRETGATKGNRQLEMRR